MTLQKLIACAFVATVFVSLAVAVERDESILKAFAPIKNFWAFCFQLVIVAVFFSLLAWHYFDDSELLGQRPRTWATLVAQIYAWVCFVAYLKRGK